MWNTISPEKANAEHVSTVGVCTGHQEPRFWRRRARGVRPANLVANNHMKEIGMMSYNSRRKEETIKRAQKERDGNGKAVRHRKRREHAERMCRGERHVKTTVLQYTHTQQNDNDRYRTDEKARRRATRSMLRFQGCFGE